APGSRGRSRWARWCAASPTSAWPARPSGATRRCFSGWISCPCRSADADLESYPKAVVFRLESARRVLAEPAATQLRRGDDTATTHQPEKRRERPAAAAPPTFLLRRALAGPAADVAGGPHRRRIRRAHPRPRLPGRGRAAREG